MQFLLFLLIASTLIAAIQCPLTPLELTERAYAAQKEWHLIWKDLLDKGEIIKTQRPNQSGKMVDFYKLTGETIQKMKLSDAFKLLQNWNAISQGGPETKRQKFFQLNIAGEDYIFRLKRDKNNQIMVYDEKGKAPEYDIIFKYFQSQSAYASEDDIAEQILKACNEEVGSQSEFTFSGADQLKKMMRDLMVVGQVAEAATMSDEYFDKLSELFKEKNNFKIETRQTYWNSEMQANFQRQNREIYENVDTYDELFELCEELRNAEDPDKIKELKNQIAEKIPKPSDAFFEGLKKAADGGSDEEKKIKKVVEKLGVEDLTNEQYNNIKDNIDVLKTSKDEEEIENAKKEILENLPELTEHYYETLTTASGTAEEEANDLAQKQWANAINSQLYSETGQELSKFGRIPGQDYIFRLAVKEVAKGAAKFKKIFTDIFPIHLKGGAAKARSRLFGDAFDVEDEVTASEQRLKKLKTERDAKAAAVGAGDSNTVKAAIDDSVKGDGCVFVSQAGRAICSSKSMKLIEDSFDWTDEGLEFETIDEDGIKMKHEVEIKKEDMGLPKYMKESVANFEELGVKRESENEPSPPPEFEAANRGLGIYGAFVNILSSAKYLQRGEYGQAAFSAVQAVHTIGSLTGLDKVIEEAAQKAFAKLIGFTADKAGVEKAMERMLELATKAVGETTARILDRILGSLPLIGIAFDLYFVAEDIKDLMDKNSDTPLGLKIAHLVLDYTIMDLSIVESLVPELSPVIEPVILALTMIRVSIDDFYMDIKRELTKAKGKSFGKQFEAFLLGYEEGIADVFTLGLFTQLESLQDQVNFDHELLQNMTDPAKYFEYRFNNSQGDLDFTSGAVSQYGGFLDVKMHNNGSVRMVMAEVPSEDGGPPQTIIKTFDFHNPVDEIVLGIGEVQLPVYMQETAYLWMFIPIKSDDVISDLDKHGSSRYGVYTGNDGNNTFYAIQTQADPESKAQIQSAGQKVQPQADLESKAPQMHLTRRKDRNASNNQQFPVSTKMEKNNMMEDDLSQDLNNAVKSQHKQGTIKIGFHQEDIPAQQISRMRRNLQYDEMRKVWLQQNARAQSELQNTNADNVEGNSNTIETKVIELTLSDPVSSESPIPSNDEPYSTAECDDPNASSNISIYLKHYNYDLYGGKGDDKFFLGPQQSSVSGDEGKDLYYIQPSGGKTIIDNFAIDEEMDTLYFNVSFVDIKCNRDEWDMVIGFCDTHNVRLKNWFNHEENEYYRHISIVSNDGVVMEATETDVDTKLGTYAISCNAVMVDRTGSEEGQTIKLTGRFKHVQNVYGSNYSDTIIGNELNNLINGKEGDDIMKGGEGEDIYVIDEKDGNDVIDNYAEDSKEDTIVFSVPYARIVSTRDSNDMVLGDSYHPTHSIRMRDWFTSSLFQHALFLSSDYVQFTVELDSDGTAIPVALSIDLTDFKHGVVIDLTDSSNNVNYTINKEVMTDIKVILDSPFNDRLIGNSLGNFFTCTGGTGFMKGNTGKDTFVADENCAGLTIDNYDEIKDIDILLVRCSYKDLKVYNPSNSLDLLVTCTTNSNRELVTTLLDWFRGLTYQHLYVKTNDLVTFSLPGDEDEYNQANNGLVPIQIQVDKGCNGEMIEIDLRDTKLHKVERIEASNKTCSFSIYGNNIDNYIDPGPGDPFNYQRLEGGNGTDTYVLGHNYGIYNLINNFAEDNQTDHLQFGVIFADIVAQREEDDMRLSSKSQDDSIQVKVLDYFESKLHQHLIVETADNYMFRFVEDWPYIEVIMVDLSTSEYSQIVSPSENTSYEHASIIVGSKVATNHITGGFNSEVIVGGNGSDVIIGGPKQEDLVGAGGDDSIDGGEGSDRVYGGDGDDSLLGRDGNDTFFGGNGGDSIDGGNGSDFIVFSGANYTGITVTLQVGTGLHSDAQDDEYDSIENVLGSEYDDILIGNDEDNILRGYGGRDIFFPYGGYDLLHGGIGSDLYMMEEASGIKIINNFATDEALDMVSMKNYSSDQVCHFYLEEDLIMNIAFEENNHDTIARIITAETSLEMTIALALKNTTFQHLIFFFSDDQKYIEEFSETGNQIGPVYEQVLSGYFLHITCHSENTICININFTAIDPDSVAPPDKYTLELMHMSHNDSISYPLTYIYTGGNETIKLENLYSGIENTFFGYITSCGVSVTVSQLITTVTNPNPPVNLEVVAVAFDGFTISWEQPSEETDPYSGNYSYTVKIVMENTVEDVEEMESETNDTEFTTSSLLPQTKYNVLVYSESHNTSSRHAAGLHITTDAHTCSNLGNLPNAMYIDRFDRNEVGQLVAHLSCTRGYKLVGEPLVRCDDPNTVLPECESLACFIPSVGNATLITEGYDNYTNKPLEGDLLVWECDDRFEIGINVTKFNSTCTEHSTWNPPLKSFKCKERPLCRVPPLKDGSISSNNIHVGHNVTFHCNYGYALVGPMKKQCVRTYYGSIQLKPEEKPFCNHTHCTPLTPQPDGYYSRGPPYYTDDEVTLTCYFGYYVVNRVNAPDKDFYKCIMEKWNDTVKLCRTMLHSTEMFEKISAFHVKFRWSFSAWSGVTMTTRYLDHGCRQIGGNQYENDVGVFRRCSRSFHLTDGPSRYEGILTVGDKEEVGGSSFVCIESVHAASEICDALGLSLYTASIYSSPGIITTKILKGDSFNGNLSDHTKTCNSRISCRARCDPLTLKNGEVSCPSERPFEGESCRFSCKAGYFQIGDKERTCTADGWSGTHTFCDGETWKSEIEMVTRQNSHMKRIDLAKTLFNHLYAMFSPNGNINWHVIIYDDVTGGDKHEIIGYDYHHLFRHYGNNIIVMRLIWPRDRGDPSDLRGDFLKAYEPSFDGSHLNCERTAHNTWNNLPQHGIAPWNVFFLRAGIAYGAYGQVTERIAFIELPSKAGISIVMGEKY